MKKEEEAKFEAFQFDFSKDEMLGMGRELAQQNREIYDLERQKKEQMADLSAQIKAANGRAESLTNRLNSGFEVRDVQILYCMDTPTEGQKTVVRVDLNEPVRVEAMTPEEKQRELFEEDMSGRP